MDPREIGLVEREPLLKGLRVGQLSEKLIGLIGRSFSDFVAVRASSGGRARSCQGSRAAVLILRVESRVDEIIGGIVAELSFLVAEVLHATLGGRHHRMVMHRVVVMMMMIVNVVMVRRWRAHLLIALIVVHVGRVILVDLASSHHWWWWWWRRRYWFHHSSHSLMMLLNI